MNALGGFAQHARAGIRLLYDASTTNVDVQADAGSPNGPVNLHISVLSGVVIDSALVGVPAFDISGVASGSFGLLDNVGKLRGIGGNGGRGRRVLNGNSGGGGGGAGDDVGQGASNGGSDGTTTTGGAGGGLTGSSGHSSAADNGAPGGAAINSSGVSLTIINANGEIHGGGGGGGGGGGTGLASGTAAAAAISETLGLVAVVTIRAPAVRAVTQ